MNRWNGKGWGIGEQEWSKKSIEFITPSDITTYFNILSNRGSNGNAKQKEAQKSLLNHLNELAKDDFPNLQKFRFPKISKTSKEVQHLTKIEFEKLVHKINELSGGLARKTISPREYQNLEWTGRDIFNQRNWVDLYDCLMLNYFFYLRPLDIPRLKSEWFREGEDDVKLFLEKTKADRAKHTTTHYRPDGYKFWKRMNSRRPKGYLAFPFYPREVGNENASNVGATLNKMLQHAVDLCHIKKREKVVWGIIRHTAFRLTLEDLPHLGTAGTYIESFAANGMTSSKMLREVYLKFIDADRVAQDARKIIPESSFSLLKRVSLD